MNGFAMLLLTIVDPIVRFFQTDKQKKKNEKRADEFLEKQAEARKLIDEKKEKRNDT